MRLLGATHASRSIGKGLAILAVLLIAWQILVVVTGVPHFILPSPLSVARSLYQNAGLLLSHAGVTAAEIVLGLLLGSVLGVASALLLTASQRARRYGLPLMIVSQSLPVFAIAPLLTLWFGFGISSKVAMATLIIYFPIVAAAFDGLRHTPQDSLALARVLGATPFNLLWRVRLPHALPALASGLRVATSVAPIGAVVGEWVGSSRGLGYLMLHANARMQVDLMFSALFCLALLAVLLYAIVNALLDRLLFWQHDSVSSISH